MGSKLKVIAGACLAAMSLSINGLVAQAQVPQP